MGHAPSSDRPELNHNWMQRGWKEWLHGSRRAIRSSPSYPLKQMLHTSGSAGGSVGAGLFPGAPASLWPHSAREDWGASTGIGPGEWFDHRGSSSQQHSVPYTRVGPAVLMRDRMQRTFGGAGDRSATATAAVSWRMRRMRTSRSICAIARACANCRRSW
eukprot:scaffold4420_cov115-Isochrysis_galbana.AAC.4